MAKNKKKGPAPNKKQPKRRRSTSQILFAIFAVFMVLLMIVPYILSIFQ